MNLPSPWATGRYSDSMPARKTHFWPSTRSRTQRSSYLPESLSVSVAGGPFSASGGSRMPDLIITWKPLQMPRISLPSALNWASGVGQVMLDLVGQDAAGGHVVAVAESARQAEDLEPLDQPGVLQEAVDVQRFALGPRLLEGERAFLVAVGAGGSQDEDVGLGHKRD